MLVRWASFGESLSRVRQVGWPIASVLAVALLAAGCFPDTGMLARQAVGVLPAGAGQVPTRPVEILYTGFGRGVVDPVTSGYT